MVVQFDFVVGFFGVLVGFFRLFAFINLCLTKEHKKHTFYFVCSEYGQTMQSVLNYGYLGTLQRALLTK